jgi:hypothetical protein
LSVVPSNLQVTDGGHSQQPPDEVATALTLTKQTSAEHDAPRLWPAPEPPASPGSPPTARSGPLDGPGFASAQDGGPVHPATLALLACWDRLRRVLLDEHGAVLHLGRTARYATPAQKSALLARDGGCLIPGCLVPGEHCDVHHPLAWADGGPTDLTHLTSR